MTQRTQRHGTYKKEVNSTRKRIIFDKRLEVPSWVPLTALKSISKLGGYRFIYTLKLNPPGMSAIIIMITKN